MAAIPSDSTLAFARDADKVNEETGSLAEQVASSVLKDDNDDDR